MLDSVNYIINLPERTDRRAEMEKQLGLAGLDATFFPAIRPDAADGFPSIGARGCFMSHLSVLKAAAGQRRHLLIMEDDLDFVDDFRCQWSAIAQEIEKKSWSIFYPAHVIDGLPAGLQEVPAAQGIMCTHFLLVHRDALAGLIAGLVGILRRPPGHPDGGLMHVDGAYSTLRFQNPALRTFAYSPALGRQRPSRSDIAGLKFYDRFSALRFGANFYRTLKRSIAD